MMELPRHRRSIPPVSSRSWLIAKVALQALSLACCAIVIGLSVATTWEDGSGVGILTIPIVVATAAWTIAELVTQCVRRRRAPGRGIHPGAHVGVQLVIFLAMIFLLFYSCMLWKSVQRSLVACNEWPRQSPDSDWVVQGNTPVGNDRDQYWTGFYCPESYREMINSPSYRSSVQAIIAFCALLWVIHFSLFVRACVETQRRNREEPVVMMYPQPVWPAPYGADQPYGGPPPGRPVPMKETHYR
ncbi:hypothetical protein F4677DRAFT_334417 [Hypoxylon crocopeplum]|nr:hypothetical protein F4677DRAFT_334417 [Hypoxylon crocopeplum]